MNHPPLPSTHNPGLQRCHGSRVLLVALGVLVAVSGAFAADHQVITRKAGGVSPHPDIRSVSKGTNGIVLQWNGFAGPYQLERAVDIVSGKWEKVGSPTDARTLTLPPDGDIGFLRINGGSPSFAGVEACMECHPGTHSDWAQTRHAGAFETLRAIKQEKNARCLPCHTVGFGLPTGFKDEATTPFYAGVQCENCHGPAGDHAMKPLDKSLRPVKEVSALICGGCHTDFHHPTFDEWATAGHGKVTASVASSLLTGGEARMQSCGACHSGAVRMAMMEGKEKNKAVVYPTGQAASTTSVTCSVCHDAHKKTANGSMLRNPTHSLKPFSYSTSTNTSFAVQYDPEVNMCGQCHNMRGASWKDTGRPPHHSPQYNMLIGNGGVEDGTPPQSKHRDNLKQCAGCHTHPHPTENPSEENPVYTGHKFEPHLANCTECHAGNDAASKMAKTQADVKARILEVQALLNQWGETKANDVLRAKYGKYTWEFSSPGQLSNPTGSSAIKAPTSAEQSVIPDGIKQARFNLYLVEHDASKGVHNAAYAMYLLQVAENRVKAALAQ